jgi:NitT/TauT family transport system substrate-binding protein
MSFSTRLLIPVALLAVSGAVALATGPAADATVIEIGIGMQNGTTNTVTGGIVLEQLGLLEKHLPRTGRYENVRYSLSWQNATSGPPITNGMMAGNLQIGMMGDYPLLVNGATGQKTHNPTELVAIIAYNAHGGGNGIVVPKDSPYYQLEDLRGKKVSVPFGSAAHGMMLQALERRGLPATFWDLVSQSPEIGSTNLQEHRIDAHGDFVPFAELLPFRGIARKIFDGAETRHPTFHGVVIRKDFGGKHPEIVVAYLKALLEANEWVRKDPRGAAEKIEAWTKIDKEVVYMFLGPGGVHTLDPTLKPRWIEALGVDHATLRKLDLVGEIDIPTWVNDGYLRRAYTELGRDYDSELASFATPPIEGHDPVCQVPVSGGGEPGQIWLEGGDVVPLSSAGCTLAGVQHYTLAGQALGAVYVTDHALGIQLFADTAFYVLAEGAAPNRTAVAFLLKRDAEQYARETRGRVATFNEALSAIEGPR